MRRYENGARVAVAFFQDDISSRANGRCGGIIERYTGSPTGVTTEYVIRWSHTSARKVLKLVVCIDQTPRLVETLVTETEELGRKVLRFIDQYCVVYWAWI